MHGGDRIARVLAAQGVTHLFTLCGGHISPILVGSKRLGIEIVDTRHEVNAVFAADAYARLSGIPGVAAVTAGPGVTNTLTALKNAQMAQSPLVLIGGATATALKGRGALQDIDQMSLIKPHVKWAAQLEKVRDLAPAMEEAFRKAASGTPGPVFVEVPVDLLYNEEIVREWYGGKLQKRSVGEKALAWYLEKHVDTVFGDTDDARAPHVEAALVRQPSPSKVRKAVDALRRAERPLFLVGSQSVVEARRAWDLKGALERMGIPCYLSGMARGLLGAGHELHMRHKRREALKQADVVVLAGVPCDFRLDYGSHIKRKSFLIAANRRSADIYKNRVPDLACVSDAGAFLRRVADELEGDARRDAWLEELRERDAKRDAQIEADSAAPAEGGLNPLAVCKALEAQLDDDSVLVADGGDFVATASYITKPRGPLSWLDPGVFGTLGVGGGFALGAKSVRPDAEVWILYGDGSAGYSIAEFDTYVRCNKPVIAVVGNDASWQQIARDQVELLGDAVGTELLRTDYHRVAQGFGGKGLLLDKIEDAPKVFAEAKRLCRAGHPVLVNVHIGKTDFRKGSISI